MHRHEIDRLMTEEHQEKTMVKTSRKRPHKEIRDKTTDMVTNDSFKKKSRYRKVRKTTEKTIVGDAVSSVVGEPVIEESVSAKDVISDIIHTVDQTEALVSTPEEVSVEEPTIDEVETPVYGFTLVGEPHEVHPRKEQKPKAEKQTPKTEEGKPFKKSEDVSFKSAMSAFFNLFA